MTLKRVLWTYLGWIIGLIIFFGILYLSIDGVLLKKNSNIIDALYFSVVTITTLGFGEITPQNGVGKFLVSAEVIMGLVFIGLFINSLGGLISSSIQKNQDKIINDQLAILNKRKLVNYWKYFNLILENFKTAFFELTSPLDKRKDFKEINPDFKFCDLKSMYQPSLFFFKGFKKEIIFHYYDALDELLKELRFMLSNFDLIEYSELEGLVHDLTVYLKGTDIREVFISYTKMGGGAKPISEELLKMIAKFEDRPDPEKYKSNIITPVISLYDSLKIILPLINELEKEYSNIIDIDQNIRND